MSSPSGTGPQRWERVRAVLEGALERPEAERSSLLDAACGSDRELREEIESLIAYEDRAERFLENPSMSGTESRKLVGHSLAHYEILEEVGRGGMGVVYRANDTKLGRDIAIKVLPETVSRDKERLARFEREARLLASLNHTSSPYPKQSHSFTNRAVPPTGAWSSSTSRDKRSRSRLRPDPTIMLDFHQTAGRLP